MDADLEALIGAHVGAEVFGWRDARRREPGAPLLDGVPLHVSGILSRRESPRVGTIWSVGPWDVDPATVRPDPAPVEPPWDHLAERADTVWKAKLRRRQSWYRQHVLGLPPGEGGRPPRPVASMLPAAAVAADTTLNFLCDPTLEQLAAARLVARDAGGLVDERRLYHNLLSSQPLCFNLFGSLAGRPDVLLEVLRQVFGVDATTVGSPLVEWAPPRAEHLGGGSAFDCFIPYQTSRGPGFVGVETKYAEHLADQRPSANPAYRERTERAQSGFKPGAADRLDRPATCQLWYNALLAQSLRAAEADYVEGLMVLAACADDHPAAAAADALRGELDDPDGLVRRVSYEDILAVAGDEPWAEHFRLRYLDTNLAG